MEGFGGLKVRRLTGRGVREDYSTGQERASTTAYEEAAGEADLGSCGERRVFAVGD